MHFIVGYFYTGQVFVGLKENAFQPSSPIRHVMELNHVLDIANIPKQPILLLYTEGGPDYHLTYVSVQISLINLFLEQDLMPCELHHIIAGKTHQKG